ncbi:hypothetical protein ElyMa_000465700 [Elysia marginata]|uniref:Helitron helicase-like domain-containing protein n=1 Tax=Elysia marginata TaxID=1093978 RepID=A0AAV4FR42_9GAST|nr:hypothetical protein ElyMa_000465700 [Elysia marginata]
MPKKRRRSALTQPRRVRARTLHLDQDNNDQDALELPQLPQAFVYDVNSFKYQCYIGELTTQCTHCLAFKFPNETSGMCCSNGKVDLQPFPEPPPELQLLLSGESALSNHFFEKIRLYNNCFQLTSMGYTYATLNGWNPQFRVKCQVYHRIGSLLPSTQNQHSFLQVYFMENDAASARIYSLFQGLQPRIISYLQDMLHRHNSYVIQLQCAYERQLEEVIFMGTRTHLQAHSKYARSREWWRFDISRLASQLRQRSNSTNDF